jgi:MarC family membrane protein
MQMFSIALSLFLLMDSIGNIPLFLAFLKNVPPKRQPIVILREMLIAFAIVVCFSFLGDGLMHFLNVNEATIQIAGGIILFILCIKMIFPPAHQSEESLPHEGEPFVVPLAIPLVAGPSTLSAVLIYAKQVSEWVLLGGILIAWGASLLILLSSNMLQKFLGWRGLTALERLMGLILILIAVQMFLSGLDFFLYS